MSFRQLLLGIFCVCAPVFAQTNDEVKQENEGDKIESTVSETKTASIFELIALAGTTITHKELIFAGFLNEGESDPLKKTIETIEKSKEILLNLSRSNAHIGVRRAAASEFIRATKINEDSDYEAYGPELITSTMSQCSFFEDCLQLIKDLALVTEALPESIYEEGFRAEVIESFKSVSSPILQDMLRYRFESLITTAFLYASSGIYRVDQIGRSLYIEEPVRQFILKWSDYLTDANSYYQRANLDFAKMRAVLILNQNKQTVRLDQLTPGRMRVADAAFARFDKPTQTRLDALAKSQLDSWQFTYYGNLSLKIFLSRFNLKDPASWLQGFKVAMEVGLEKQQAFDPAAALISLSRFAKPLLALPDRRDVVAVAEAMAKQIDQKKYPFLPVEVVIKDLKDRLKFVEDKINGGLKNRQMRDFVDDDQFTSFESTPAHEKWLAAHFPNFHSFTYQLLAIDKAVFPLLSDLDRQNEARREEEKTKIGLRIADEMTDASLPYVRLLCYGLWLKDMNGGSELHTLSKHMPRKMIKLLFGDEEADARTVCGRDPQKIDLAINAFFSEKAFSTMAWGYGLQAGSNLMLPLFAIPSGFATRYAMAYSAKVFVKNKLMPKLIGAAVGATTFTLTQRTLMAALGVKKFYDPRVGFWKDWGPDLFMGTAIFFIGPELNGLVMKGLAKRMGIESAEALAIRIATGEMTVYEEGFVTTRLLGANTAFFTALPYGDRLFKKLTGQKIDIWQGGEQLWKDFNNAVAVTLIFQGFHMYQNYLYRSEALYEKLPEGNFYRILKSPRNSSQRRLTKSYDKLLREYENDPVKTAEVEEAYKTLGDRDKRRVYDNQSTFYDDLGIPLYDNLGRRRKISQDEIKKAYRHQAVKNHPDKNPGDKEAEARFKQSQKAYDTLGDEKLRESYDQTLEGGRTWLKDIGTLTEDFINWLKKQRGTQNSEDLDQLMLPDLRQKMLPDLREDASDQ